MRSHRPGPRSWRWRRRQRRRSGSWKQHARRPDQLEVEFGLSFSAKGNVIVAGTEAGATLKVKMVYHANPAG